MPIDHSQLTPEDRRTIYDEERARLAADRYVRVHKGWLWALGIIVALLFVGALVHKHYEYAHDGYDGWSKGSGTCPMHDGLLQRGAKGGDMQRMHQSMRGQRWNAQQPMQDGWKTEPQSNASDSWDFPVAPAPQPYQN